MTTEPPPPLTPDQRYALWIAATDSRESLVLSSIRAALARLDYLEELDRRTLRWTSERPKNTGRWWYRPSWVEPMQVVHVIDDPEFGILAMIGHWTPVIDMPGHWAGLIPPPIEDEG